MSTLSRDQVLALIRERADHPATVQELLQVLRVPRQERSTLRRHLKALVATGDLIQIRGNRFGLPDRMDVVVGRLETHPRGFGFVIPERPMSRHIYISGAATSTKRCTATASSSASSAIKDGGRAEGRIIRILERAQRVDRRPLRPRRRPAWATSCRSIAACSMDVLRAAGPGRRRVAGRDGDRRDHALADRDARRRSAASPKCSATSTRPASTPRSSSASTASPTRTATDAVAEAHAPRRRGVASRTSRGRTDFRDVPTVTIDGEHARDFDDAITIEKLPNGNFWLGVHIADVSHYVQEGSALDREAYERGTSVYFPERAVHMFPSELATGLCSLNPHVDRLVQSCLMEVDRRGQVVRARVPRRRDQQQRADDLHRRSTAS